VANALQLRQFLPYRLNDLAERVSRGLAQSYSRDFDLTVAEWRVLATLAEHGAGQARQVARWTNLDKVRVSRAVSRLAERGLVRRRRNEDDLRTADLSLTGAGDDLVATIAPRALAWEARLLDGLPPAEQRALQRGLALLEARLDALEAEGPP
jgi:DNA-binding MarR family transcriptional regulator